MKKATLFTCLAIFLVQLDATILYIAFSSISASFPSSTSMQMSWVLNVYTLVFGSLLIPAGAAGDRFGRKRVFLIGTSLFTLASLLCGLSTSAELLIGMRLLQAVGAALLVPTSLALLLSETPIERRTIAVSFWGASAALGAAIGPALGGILIDSLGWHWVFFINVPIGAFVIWSAARNLAESTRYEDRRLPSFTSVALIIIAMICMSYAVLAEGREQTDPTAFWVGGLGLLLLSIFILQCSSSSNPLIDLRLFRNPTIAIANAGSFFYFLAFSIIFFGSVQSLMHEWHYAAGTAGLIMLPGPLAVIPVAIFTGRTAKTRGPKGLIIAGTLLVAGGLILQRASYGYLETVFTSWLPGWIMIGIGNGMVMPCLAAAATIGLPSHQYAAGSGLNNSIRQFGGLLGVAVAVSFIGKGASRSASYLNMFMTAGILVLVVTLLSAILPSQATSK